MSGQNTHAKSVHQGGCLPRFVSLIVLPLLAGCTSTVLVLPDEPMNNDRKFNYRQVNDRVIGMRVQVACLNGATYSADSLIVESDSTSFISAVDGTHARIATSALKSVTRRVHDGKAVLNGVLGGAGCGLAAGIGTGLLIGHPGEDRRWAEFGLGVGFGAFGALMGGVVGGLNGREEVFQFTRPN